MKPKKAKSFDPVDEHSVTAVLGDTTVLLDPPPGPGAPPDSGDTVTMNVLVAPAVDEMLATAADERGWTAELLPPEMMRSADDDAAD